ncbi:nuclear transport factor 2 family protein [Actinosynnema sp. NPDC047251]|uniref:SnoaL-like domain-containing protein n=1 Tax=Saccharothrix espanaensis (strain ATCC 51144 / DSM 44229 / JCM 9112 / NBRC 15066 / NRRL 15764) TaxID=1179773 RepID=K0JX77_SACES|nr:nuclear transport factor 2 family protein [Saccharothrix espanaensis]CCH30656.1 hypothetical protein BN6_33540 [Saccharothrix espanaensis DSM 44229]
MPEVHSPAGERAEHAAVFHTWAKAISDADLDSYLTCFSEDTVVEDLALDTTTRGLEAVKEGAARWFAAFRDTSLDLTCHLEGDGHAAVSWTYTGVVADAHPGVFDRSAVGRRFTKHGISLFRFDDENRFAWERSYWDLGELQRSVSGED